MKSNERLVVVLCGASVPGYRSLSNAYLLEALKRDPRLPEMWISPLDVTTALDPWWLAYRLLDTDPVPDVFGFSVMCWNARMVFDAIRVLKEARPDAFVVVGGPEVGPIAEQVLSEQPGIDAVVHGEGEQAFPDLLYSRVRGGDIGSVPGVTARVDGQIAKGPARPPIEDMDSIPSPFQGRAHATDGSAYVETYRGCPHKCAYCYEGKGSTRIRSFSWGRIASDIEAVAATPGMRSFSFIDPVFNLTEDRLERLSAIMAPWAQKGITLHTIEVDIERVDARQAELLSAAGVTSVETGPQTIGASALAACGRSLDRGRFRAGIEACRAHGITVECDLIVGLPGDTPDDVIAGIDFVIDCDPGRVQMSTLHVLPGTDLWSRSVDLGLVYDSLPPHEIIRTDTMSFAELRRLEVLGNAACVAYRARLV